MKKSELDKEEEKIIEQYRKKKQKEAKEDKSKAKPKKKKHVTLNTLTKRLIVVLLIVLCIWVTWTYALTTYCTLRNYDITVIQSLCELSGKALEVILGSVVVYLIKSLRETKYKESTKLEYARDGLEYNDFDDSNI